jgi:hypothetical protein
MFAKPFVSLIIWMELLAFLSTCMMWLSNLIFSFAASLQTMALDGTKDQI